MSRVNCGGFELGEGLMIENGILKTTGANASETSTLINCGGFRIGEGLIFENGKLSCSGGGATPADISIEEWDGDTTGKVVFGNGYVKVKDLDFDLDNAVFPKVLKATCTWRDEGEFEYYGLKETNMDTDILAEDGEPVYKSLVYSDSEFGDWYVIVAKAGSPVPSWVKDVETIPEDGIYVNALLNGSPQSNSYIKKVEVIR